MMKSVALTPFQTAALTAIQSAAERRDWKGESAVVEDMLVYQVPLPHDPDAAGAFFAVDSDETNILFYLLIPSALPKLAMTEGCEFVTRHGGGMRFGALDLDLDHGTLRVRMDCDASVDDADAAVERLIARGRRLAHKISAPWRQLCSDMQSAQTVAKDYATKPADGNS